jgi:hypothetical protein
MRRFRRPVLAWIAGLALLLAAVAPTLAMSLVGVGAAPWTEVCTGQGPRWVRLGIDDAGDSRLDGGRKPVAVHLLDHCPGCLTAPMVLPDAGRGTGLHGPVATVRGLRPVASPARKAPRAAGSAWARAPPEARASA